VLLLRICFFPRNRFQFELKELKRRQEEEERRRQEEIIKRSPPPQSVDRPDGGEKSETTSIKSGSKSDYNRFFSFRTNRHQFFVLILKICLTTFGS
jgi:hypothetical protein